MHSAYQYWPWPDFSESEQGVREWSTVYTSHWHLPEQVLVPIDMLQVFSRCVAAPSCIWECPIPLDRILGMEEKFQ